MMGRRGRGMESRSCATGCSVGSRSAGGRAEARPSRGARLRFGPRTCVLALGPSPLLLFFSSWLKFVNGWTVAPGSAQDRLGELPMPGVSPPDHGEKDMIAFRPVRLVVLGLALTGLSGWGNGSLAQCVFARGDVNNSGVIDLNDAVDILAYIFLGESVPPC